MATFWSLIKDSIIVQSLITVIFTCLVAYLVYAGREVPPEVWTTYGSILGFWFGTKVTYATMKARE